MTYEFDIHFKVQLPTPILNAFEREKLLNQYRTNHDEDGNRKHRSMDEWDKYDEYDAVLCEAEEPYQKDADKQWEDVQNALDDACYYLQHDKKTLLDVFRSALADHVHYNDALNLLQSVKVLSADIPDLFSLPDGEIDEGVEPPYIQNGKKVDISEWDERWNKDGKLVASLPPIDTKEVA